MNSFFREHFESTMRDLCLFIRIILAAIVLGFIGYNHLNMTFRPKSSALEKRDFIFHTSFIHILPCPNVIECIRDYVSAFEKLIRVDFL